MRRTVDREIRVVVSRWSSMEPVGADDMLAVELLRTLWIGT